MTTALAMEANTDGLGEMIAESAARMFQRFGIRANGSVRANVEDGIVAQDAWAEVVQAGFPLAMLEEEAGGVGPGHAFAILAIAAENAFVSPLAETMGANWILAKTGLEPTEGVATFVDTVFDLTPSGADWTLSGSALVPWGRTGEVVALTRDGERFYIVRLASSDAVVIQGSNLAGEPRDQWTFATTLSKARFAAAPANFDAETIRKLGAAIRSAQMAGAMNGVLGMTVAYAKERKQFGRSLSGFQAIQQLLATMATQSAAADVAAEMAAGAIDRDMEFCAIAAAKIRTGEAAGAVAAAAHQIHGAIGFTREYPLHLLTRRLWAWRDEFGGEATWSIALGRILVAAGAAAFWPKLTAI